MLHLALTSWRITNLKQETLDSHLAQTTLAFGEGGLPYTMGQRGATPHRSSFRVAFIPQQTFEIDFTQDVRDALLLSIPMKNLHSPDCKGVQLDGEPARLDERLAKLGSLYDRLREEEMNSGSTGSVSQG